MTIVRRPSPFGELLSLRQAMDRLFEDSFVRPAGWNGSSDGVALPLDVSVDAEELVVQAALPGVRPEAVEITVEDGTLTIRGDSPSDRREGEGEYLVREIRRGSFARAITLPNGLEPDRASATFEHGILTLRVPRAEQVKPRQIRISANGQPTADTAAHPDGEQG